jgi:hypothetical protein
MIYQRSIHASFLSIQSTNDPYPSVMNLARKYNGAVRSAFQSASLQPNPPTKLAAVSMSLRSR